MKLKKTKVPELMAIYAARWFGYRWNATVWRIAFGNKAKLPVDSDHCIISDDRRELSVVLYLEPMGPRGTRRHRVFVKCPRCSMRIPAGRIHQHTCI